MRERVMVILMALMSMGLFFGCGNTAGALDGTWYEQTASNADTIEIRGSRLTYRYGFETTDNVAYKGGFKLAKNCTRTQIVLDKNADFYEELYYDAAKDLITTEIFADDYGLIEHAFKRTVYEAPPEPVYGERTDESDPDAPKEIRWDRIAGAEVSFYESVDYRGYTMNTAMLPQTGRYDYTFSVGEEVTVSSNYCSAEIPLPADTLADIRRYAESCSLAALNGLNVHTKDVPETIADYTIRLIYDDGTSFFSSANWKDVPADWDRFMRLANEAVFSAFISAGYDPYSGEYKPWIPMKRFGADPEDADARLTVPVEESVKKSEEISGAYTKVTWKRFVTDGLQNEKLAAVLQDFNRYAEDKAAKDYENAYARLTEGMKGHRRKKDEVIFSSLWTTFRVLHADNIMLIIQKGEGDWETFYTDGPEETYTYYIISAENGEILTAADLFTDREWIADYLADYFAGYTNPGFNGYFQSDEFVGKLRGMVLEPDKNGNPDIMITSAGPKFIMSKKLFPDSPIDLYTEVTIPYEEIQNIMNEDYVKVW